MSPRTAQAHDRLRSYQVSPTAFEQPRGAQGGGGVVMALPVAYRWRPLLKWCWAVALVVRAVSVRAQTACEPERALHAPRPPTARRR